MAGEIPVYGPGTTNKLIPWLNVTKAPYNYALAPYLGNSLTWGTWGSENQPVTFPMGHSQLEYSLAQDYNNPNHVRQWNPMLFGYDLGNSNMTNPIAVAQGNMNAYNMGALMADTLMAKSKIASIAQTLATMESKLAKVLQSDKLTDDQRKALQALLETIQAKKEEIQNRLQEDSSVESIEAIQGEILALQEEISKTVEEVISEIQSTSPEGTTPSEDSTPGTSNVSEDAMAQFAAQQKKRLTESLDICKDIYAGSIGNTWGTDYDTIRKGTAKINKDNAATVILAWDKQHKPISGKSLVKALFDEEHFWNPSLQDRGSDNKVDNKNAKNIDMIWNIVVSLEEKAKELDIYTELAGAFTIAYDELDDTSVDEDAIENAINTIAKAVYERQTEKEAQDVQNGIDNTTKIEQAQRRKKEEAEARAEEDNRINQEIALFATDLRDVFEDDSAEVSEKVEYKDGKFQIRIKGETYYGKTFNELKKAVEDAGYDAKKYLTKQKLNIAA